MNSLYHTDVKLLTKQIESINRILILKSLEQSELGSRLSQLKSEIASYKNLIEAPLNIGVIGNADSGKCDLINKVLSLNGSWKFPVFDFGGEVCGMFSDCRNAVETYIIDSCGERQFVDSSILNSRNNASLQTAKRLDIYFPADNVLTQNFSKRNVSVTLYPNFDYLYLLKNLDLAIIVIKANDYNKYSQLLNYIVYNDHITIPLIIVFTFADEIDNQQYLYQAYQSFDYKFILKEDSQIEISQIVNYLNHCVNPTRNAIYNNIAKIEQHSLDLIIKNRDKLKQNLITVKNAIEQWHFADNGFSIERIVKSPEAQNVKQYLLVNLENQFGKYLLEIDSMIAEVNRARNIDDIDYITKYLKKRCNFEHHCQNANYYYLNYKNGIKELIEKNINHNISQGENRKQLKETTENAFLDSLDMDFENIYKPLDISLLGTLTNKSCHYFKLAFKNMISLVSNPNILMAILIGVGVVFALIMVLGMANTFPFSLILSDNILATLTKAVMFLVVILSALILLVIWVTTRKNKKIAFANYKTNAIKNLNSLQKRFPRSSIEENIDNNNKYIVAQIKEEERYISENKRKEAEIKEQIIEITDNLLDNL